MSLTVSDGLFYLVEVSGVHQFRHLLRRADPAVIDGISIPFHQHGDLGVVSRSGILLSVQVLREELLGQVGGWRVASQEPLEEAGEADSFFAGPFGAVAEAELPSPAFEEFGVAQGLQLHDPAPLFAEEQDQKVTQRQSL